MQSNPAEFVCHHTLWERFTLDPGLSAFRALLLVKVQSVCTPTLRETHVSGIHFQNWKNFCVFAQGLPWVWKQAWLCHTALSKSVLSAGGRKSCGSVKTVSCAPRRIGTCCRSLQVLPSPLACGQRSLWAGQGFWEAELTSPDVSTDPREFTVVIKLSWPSSATADGKALGDGEMSCLLLSMLGTWRQTLKVWGLVVWCR